MSRSAIGYNEGAQETMNSFSNVRKYSPPCGAASKLLR
jgi:hypothetical protein